MAEPTQAEINRIIAGYNRAEGAVGYADSISCTAELVEGDNYRMVWSEEYDGPFEPDR